mgnify:CR=1 FL=1
MIHHEQVQTISQADLTSGLTNGIPLNGAVSVGQTYPSYSNGISIDPNYYNTTYSIPHQSTTLITKEMFDLRKIGDFTITIYDQIFIDKRIKGRLMKEKELFSLIQKSLQIGGKIFWVEDHDDVKQLANSRIDMLKS